MQPSSFFFSALSVPFMLVDFSFFREITIHCAHIIHIKKQINNTKNTNGNGTLFSCIFWCGNWETNLLFAVLCILQKCTTIVPSKGLCETIKNRAELRCFLKVSKSLAVHTQAQTLSNKTYFKKGNI